MKTRLRFSLLIGVLALFAQGASAQRLATGPAACRGVYSSSRVWIPAGFETVLSRVWVPGCTERVWIEPRFELRYDRCGNAFRTLVAAGHHELVHRPGHYETRPVRVWRPGYWAPRGSCRW
jgi:hypothetical protein